jgi:hypothetical protein
VCSRCFTSRELHAEQLNIEPPQCHAKLGVAAVQIVQTMRLDRASRKFLHQDIFGINEIRADVVARYPWSGNTMCADKVRCCNFASHSQASWQCRRVWQSSEDRSAIFHTHFEHTLGTAFSKFVETTNVRLGLVHSSCSCSFQLIDIEWKVSFGQLCILNVSVK